MSQTARRAALCAAFLLCPAAAAQVGAGPGLVDPNLADRAALLALPHVTPEAAAAIEAARPVLRPTGLDRALAPHLDPSERAELYGRLFRHLDLNGASREEIMLIPGMTRRMAREIEEYRPYDGLVRFRREIGKYVDADEVARLERYVFVPMNLNRASPEDFMTIPGMTRRMVREFEEYRPYDGMERFRREIGKYVDADEVARLESYLTLD